MTVPRGAYRSWGGLSAQGSEIVDAADWIERPDRFRRPVLAYGNGRSYGDSCLNSRGSLIDARSLANVQTFDRETGLLTCGAGLLLDRLLDIVVPAGWFPCVTPGTSFVTIGGALANESEAEGEGNDKDYEPVRADPPEKRPLPLSDNSHEI